jgi:PmbA protein
LSAPSSAEEVVERTLGKLRAAGAAAADCMLVESESLDVRVRGEEIDHVTQSREKSLGVRAFVQGESGLQQAMSSSADLGDEAVARLVEHTLALARATAGDPLGGLPEAPPADALVDLGLFDPADQPAKAEDRIESARRMERAARAVDPRISNSEGSSAQSDFSTIVYGDTRGFLGSYAQGSHSLMSMPLAVEDDAKQRDYAFAVSRTLAGLREPDEIGREAGERALRRLGARPVETCEVPVLFEPRVAASLVRQIMQCASGYSIYRRASYLVDQLGEVVAAPGVNVIDDGTLPGGLGSKPFDGEGLPTRRNVLVEDGRLVQYLLDSYSARKLGAESTGSATRGPGSSPSVGPTNLWLEPGTLSPEQILASTDRGFLVTELFGHGFNPVTGDSSRGAVGFWIEGGEIAHPVEGVTVAGNLGDMLRGIDAIGSDLLWLGRVAAPSLRISRMTVAGS